MADSIEIIPSVVPEHAGDFADSVEIIKAFAPWVHLDVDDGLFTKTLTWPYVEPGLFSATPLMFSTLPVEAHLMVQASEDVGNVFVAGGAKRIIAHVETIPSPQIGRELIADWRLHGVEIGMAVLIDTPLESLDPYIEECDSITVMSIASVGAQGAPFDPRALKRVEELHAKHPPTVIAVDGGVSMANIADLARAGARRFVVGSAIMQTANPQAAYSTLKTAAQSAL